MASARVARLPGALLNALGGGLLLALAAWLWIGAADIEAGGGEGIGPDGFPRAIAVLLGVASLLLILQSARAARLHDAAAVEVRRPVAVLGAIVLVAVYPLLIAQLGYYLATAVWMLPFLFLAGMRNPLGIAASTAGFLVFTRVLFQLVLGTPMP